MSDIVTVDRSHYESLLERERWLCALEAAGVDNWEGISYAHDLYEEEDYEEHA